LFSGAGTTIEQLLRRSVQGSVRCSAVKQRDLLKGKMATAIACCEESVRKTHVSEIFSFFDSMIILLNCPESQYCQKLYI